MMKNLLALIVFGTSIAVTLPQAAAKDSPSAAKTASSKNKQGKAGKTVATTAAATGTTLVAGKLTEADLAGTISTDYSCELGNKLTIYKKLDDDQAISLRWKNSLHRLTRIGTSSGAHRFEDAQQGLVWLGIPSKGMLLNSKKGQQLANECKNAEQLAQEAGQTLPGNAVVARY